MQWIRKYAGLALMVYSSLLVGGVLHGIFHHDCEEHAEECLLAEALRISIVVPEAPQQTPVLEAVERRSVSFVSPVTSQHRTPVFARGPPASLSV